MFESDLSDNLVHFQQDQDWPNSNGMLNDPQQPAALAGRVEEGDLENVPTADAHS